MNEKIISKINSWVIIWLPYKKEILFDTDKVVKFFNICEPTIEDKCYSSIHVCVFIGISCYFDYMGLLPSIFLSFCIILSNQATHFKNVDFPLAFVFQVARADGIYKFVIGFHAVSHNKVEFIWLLQLTKESDGNLKISILPWNISWNPVVLRRLHISL